MFSYVSLGCCCSRIPVYNGNAPLISSIKTSGCQSTLSVYCEVFLATSSLRRAAVVSAVYGTYWKRQKASSTFCRMAVEVVRVRNCDMADDVKQNEAIMEKHKE